MIGRRSFLRGLAAFPCAGLAAPSTFGSEPGARRGSPAPVPQGYRWVAARTNVPPLLLYGIALQESAKLFGHRALPWPWTLNVRGTPRRYGNYGEAVADMAAIVLSGISNVDAGVMQVNWGYHRHRLQSANRALDPYPNLHIGATILREHYDATGDWFVATGRYHAPAHAARAEAYATSVYRRVARVPSAELAQDIALADLAFSGATC